MNAHQKLLTALFGPRQAPPPPEEIEQAIDAELNSAAYQVAKRMELRFALRNRLAHDGTKPMSLHQLEEQTGLNRRYIRRIEGRILRRLRGGKE